MALTRDELAERLEALAKYDPGMRIDLCRLGADTLATLGAGPAHPESTRRFRDLAVDAVALFDPDGTGDATERWLGLVCDCMPDRIAHDALRGIIHNAAEASALAVRRLGNSAEADHQPKAPAKRKPDEAVPADDGAAAQAAGPPAPAEDRTAYIPAKDVIDGEYAKDYKDLQRILKSHLWIRTYKPSGQRLTVHAGDWNRYKRERDAALDSPAVVPLIEAVEARKAAARKSHFPPTS